MLVKGGHWLICLSCKCYMYIYKIWIMGSQAPCEMGPWYGHISWSGHSGNANSSSTAWFRQILCTLFERKCYLINENVFEIHLSKIKENFIKTCLIFVFSAVHIDVTTQFSTLTSAGTVITNSAPVCVWDGHRTPLSLDNIAAIPLTTFSKAFSWMKSFVFRFRFQWSLFLRDQSAIAQHWFR